MSETTDERLYQLLPAVYRQRDAAQREPLRALLAVIEGELRLVEGDIARLYENWFIETCDEWVVPYLGDLLNVRGLLPVENGALSQRALVANALGYRRRKGTAAMLEQLARDVTGWPAKAVEFFERLATTQHLNHLRPANLCTVDLHDMDGLELLDGPFERATHTAEVRHIDNGRGRYNIPNIGLFLWRLQSYAVTRGTPRPVADPADGRYTFNPLGIAAPLFNRPRTEREITQLAGEENVPGPLRRLPLHEELEGLRQALVDGKTPSSLFFGAQPVLQIFIQRGNNSGFAMVPPEEVLICDLSDLPAAPPADWRRPPATKKYTRASDGAEVERPITVAVDPVQGRLSFRADPTLRAVEVSYAYGFGGDLGGGPYDRQASVAQWFDRTDEREIWQMGVTRNPPADDERLVATLAEAVQAWNDVLSDGEERVGIIAVMDSRTYEEGLTNSQAITVPAGSRLAIVAADWPETPDPEIPGRQQRVEGQLAPTNLRPHLRGDLAVQAGAPVPTATGGELILDGLLIEGALSVLQGQPDDSGQPTSLGGLRLAHCTLVPGHSLNEAGASREPNRPSVVVDPANNQLRLQVYRSITGPLRLPAEIADLEVRDSIIDSPTRGGRAWLTPALVSGALATIDLASDGPTIQVTIGEEGPHLAALPGKPTTVAQARDQLQVAIRTAHNSPAFIRARVINVPGANRLVVLPGIPDTVTVENAEEDTTATQLKLDRASARQVRALIGGSLAGFSGLSATSPAVQATIGEEGPHLATFTDEPATIAQARDQLQAAIRNVSGAPEAFSAALVGNLDDRLVVLPGVANAAVTFAAAPTDATTLRELALGSDRPAIAASEGGDRPGPTTTLEKTTVFGAVHVKELLLASETLFTIPPMAERRQIGCARFSYVPPGARTPRRYRCQPDAEIATRTAEAERRAEAARRSLTTEERDAIRVEVERALVPAFTSTRYGRPAYGQLAPSCPAPILTGAEDEGEMGGFHFLQQAQRVKNLRASLDEYLRFGLEAGIFFVT